VVGAEERALDPLPPVDHQVVEVEHLPARAVVPLALGVVAKVRLGDDDVAAVLLVVGQFVDGVLNSARFDDEEERPVRPADLQ
jgi:hypothetical protein